MLKIPFTMRVTAALALWVAHSIIVSGPLNAQEKTLQSAQDFVIKQLSAAKKEYSVGYDSTRYIYNQVGSFSKRGFLKPQTEGSNREYKCTIDLHITTDKYSKNGAFESGSIVVDFSQDNSYFDFGNSIYIEGNIYLYAGDFDDYANGTQRKVQTYNAIKIYLSNGEISKRVVSAMEFMEEQCAPKSAW